MIHEIKQILKWDFTAVAEEEFVRLFAARRRSQRQAALPPASPSKTPGAQAVANEDLADVLERSESGLSRDSQRSAAGAQRALSLAREVDGSVSTLQGKIRAMRVLEDYEEQNKIESLKERAVAELSLIHI